MSGDGMAAAGQAPLFIQHVTACTPGGAVEDAAVLIEGGRIAAVGPRAGVARPPEARAVDGGGLLLAPGFIDLQLNGAFGCDFTLAPETIWEVAARLPEHGVTAFLPTIISAPLETVARAQEVLAQGLPPGFVGAQPLGLHAEGPFLNPAKRGAHLEAHLRLPDPAAVEGWAPERGVRLATLAPELPGALEVARALAGRGVAVGAGHSLATLDEARAGFAAGITYGTHLFNAMPPLDHRAPGLAGALLGEERATVGLIADGVHLHPEVVALVWRAAGPSRVNLVSDAMAALGMPPGRYRLGALEAIVDETSARLADGRLAGSVLRLDQAVRNLIAYTGCAPEEALRTVSEVPARVLGMSGERGAIAPGRRGDLVLLDPALQVRATLAGGQVVFGKEALIEDW